MDLAEHLAAVRGRLPFGARLVDRRSLGRSGVGSNPRVLHFSVYARYPSRVATKHFPTPEERDERVIVPVPAEVAIPAFLAVDPSSEPVEAIEADTDADPDSEPPADQ